MEENSEKNIPIDYEKKIEQQKETLKTAADQRKNNPTDGRELEFNRELDLLRHYENAAVGNPKQRAALIAKLANEMTINKAVRQIPSVE